MGVRDDIISAARGELGQVSDQGGTGGNKLGWDHLKAYFEAALNVPDIFARGPAWQNGIQKAGQFVSGTTPEGKTWSVDWCGLFAVWALRQAGIDARWVVSKGPTGRIKDAGASGTDERGTRTDFTQMQPGDILVRHHNIHHCLVSAFDGTNLSTINGNADYQGIVESTGEAWSSVDSWYFYSIDDWAAPTP